MTCLDCWGCTGQDPQIVSQQPSPTRFDEELAAALDWWREAGVDQDYHDEPENWLAIMDADGTAAVTEQPVVKPKDLPPPPPRGPAPVQLEPIGGNSEKFPAVLADFHKFWLTEKSLDFGGTGPRILPRGAQGAKLAVLVLEPEEGDSETLLSGRQGKLVSAMLSAMGIAEDQTYIASVLPRRVPLPDWDALKAAGLAELTLHHLALAAAERILVLGRNILPIIAHDMAQDPAALREIYHDGGSMAALCADGPDRLLRHAAARARLWHRWLEWTG